MTRILSAEEIESHFTMPACLDVLETSFHELGSGAAGSTAIETLHTPVDEPPVDTTPPVYHGLRSMGGTVPSFGIAAVRLNSTVTHWPVHAETGVRVKRHLPTVDGRYTGLVVAFSTTTGEPLAVFPDGIVQLYRVAATSALGAKHLARQNAATVGLLGAGQQADAHVLALSEVRDLETVRVYSPTPASRERFAAQLDAAVDADVRAISQPRDAFGDTDIVQCATNAITPVFETAWLEPGTHIGLIREMEGPDDFWEPDAYDAFVQSHPRDAIQREMIGRNVTERRIPGRNWNFYAVEGDEPVPRFASGNYADEPFDWSRVPSLGEVMLDGSLGRSHPDGITAFYNAGIGVQFAAVAKVICDLAEAHDLGRQLPTELLTQTHHP